MILTVQIEIPDCEVSEVEGSPAFKTLEIAIRAFQQRIAEE